MGNICREPNLSKVMVRAQLLWPSFLLLVAAVYAEDTKTIALQPRTTQKITIDECTLLRIKANYRQVEFRFTEMSNVARILLTDRTFSIPGGIIASDLASCPPSSTFCSSSKPTGTFEYSVSHCLDEILIYVCPVSGKTAVLNATNAYTGPCGATSRSLETICASHNKTMCTHRVHCHQDCNWVDCRVQILPGEIKSVLGLCVPFNISQGEAFRRCEISSSYRSSPDKDPILQLCPKRMEEQESTQNLWILLGIIVAAIAGLLIVSWVYKRKLRRDRVQIFNPPGFCPSFLFPRAPEESLIHEYEPPPEQ
eukprot:TRINITY_DN4589_c0_g1_i2.p1 TRINITY_DN4589_c0_g1~~TRINITY_DN4589_c0_g1_i2.p1  ORF type:complete len:310 (+),score=29.74 TRINITY_DN4589_c0_g1_i2:88-1017(+)